MKNITSIERWCTYNIIDTWVGACNPWFSWTGSPTWTSGTSKGTVAEDPNDDWSWTILPSSKSRGNYKISGITFFKKNRISGIRLAKIRPDPDFGINFIENRQINSLFMLFKSKISFFSIRKKVEILTTKKTNYLTFMLSEKLRVCKFQFFSLFYRNIFLKPVIRPDIRNPTTTGYTVGYPDPAFFTTG